MVSLRAIPKRQYLSAFLILSLLATLAFSTRWISGKKMLFEIVWDPIPVQLFYPGDRVEASALQQGKFALWDPYRGFGSPLVMATAATIFHPIKLLSFLWGTDSGFEFALLLKFILLGFFTYLLARGLGLSHLAGLFSAIGYMFSGYFRQFHNFVDLNVEMFFPLTLLFLIRLFRNLKLSDLLCYLGIKFLQLGGFHPEPVFAFEIYIFAFAFFSAAEKISDPDKIFPQARPRIFLAFFLFLLTFLIHPAFPRVLEAVFQGWSYHPEGLGRLYFDLNHLIALFTPIFDPWLSPPRHFSAEFLPFMVVPSYLGFFLVSLALFSILNLKKSAGILVFFWLFSLFLAGILFGLPGFHSLSSIFFINRLQNFRYLQPVMALSVVIAAGFGLDQIKNGQKLKAYFVLLAGISLWLFLHFFRFRGHLPTRHFLLPISAFLIASLMLLILSWRLSRSKKTEWIAVSLTLISSLELFSCFVLTSPFYGPEAFKIQRPKFLDRVELDAHRWRFYSPDQNILPPDTASIFQLRDLRERGSLYPRPYYEFLSALNQWKDQGEAVRDFLEQGRFYLPLKLDKISSPGQDLLFGYLLSNHRQGNFSLLDQFQAGKLLAPARNYFARNDFSLGGKTRAGILIHPPGRLQPDQPIGPGELIFETGIQPGTDSRSDGAEFIILGRSETGARLLFYRFYCDPESERAGWREYPAMIPERMTIRLATLPGPKGNSVQDYSVFGSLELAGEPDPNYRLLDDSGPFLYERVNKVSRFFLTRKIEWVETEGQALSLIREGKFSREQIFLIGKNPGQEPELKTAGPAERDRIEILRDETDLVEIEVNLEKPAWLIMTDANLPGWQAILDDGPIRIYRAQYLFRAVRVNPGRHHLKFVFRPWSWRIGLGQFYGFGLPMIFLTLLAIFKKSSWTRYFYPAPSPRD